MNEMQVFNFKGNDIRTVQRGEETWWVLKDVCGILGIGKYRDAANRLEDYERGSVLVDTLGGKQEMIAVNEGGLYSVIMLSRKPEAKAFKRWVTHEVLPAIRKHGAYMTPQIIEEVLLNPDTVIKLATTLKEERKARKILEGENARQRQLIGELKPKADYLDRILSNKGLVTITQIAKDYGMSGKAMNAALQRLGIQYKQSGQWLLYAKYQDKGYTHSRTVNIVHSDGTPDVRMNTDWTQKGRLFLYDFLKARGILPVIEQEKSA